MKYAFHPDAEIEFDQAIEYYEQCAKGLGYDFSIEVYAAIKRAACYPKAWSVIEDEIRRTLVRRFPYGVLYSEENDGVFIVAVMHLHREPDYWKNRFTKG